MWLPCLHGAEQVVCQTWMWLQLSWISKEHIYYFFSFLMSAYVHMADIGNKLDKPNTSGQLCSLPDNWHLLMCCTSNIMLLIILCYFNNIINRLKKLLCSKNILAYNLDLCISVAFKIFGIHSLKNEIYVIVLIKQICFKYTITFTRLSSINPIYVNQFHTFN